MSFKEILIKNDLFRKEQQQADFKPTYDAPQGSFLERLHNCKKLIQEKAYGNISAFNFTRDAFNAGKWNDLTTKARGLFLNNTNGKIVARGFEKFFGYKERQFNSEQFLRENLKFPVSAYVKYNGFLGILGFDDNGLLFCSKSTVGGEYAEWFKEIFMLDDHKCDELLEFMRKENVGLVFEVIDPKRDPHIVEYKQQEIILLDIISLEENFADVPYCDLTDFAVRFNFKKKEIYQWFNDWDSLHVFLESVANDKNTPIEGYVLQDCNGYQFKLKGAWYKMWKMLRSFKETISKKHLVDIAGINDPIAIKFISWAKAKGDEYCKIRDIIQLRNEFERENFYCDLPKYEIVASHLVDGKWIDQVHTGTLSELRIVFWHTLKMASEKSASIDLYPGDIDKLVETLNNAVSVLGVSDKNKYTGKELED